LTVIPLERWNNIDAQNNLDICLKGGIQTRANITLAREFSAKTAPWAIWTGALSRVLC
jgi:hypothetical protein